MMARADSDPVPLSTLRAGATGRLRDARLDPQSVGLLRALGWSDDDPFRLCKAGDPCIVQVGTTRIGVSGEVAACLFVIPDSPER